MKVLGIVGSKRKSGNTAYLMGKAIDAVTSEEISGEIINLSDYSFQGCTGCEGCRKTFRCVLDDDMQLLYPRVMAADALILGSPTYFYNLTADMKAFIERFYCFQVFSSHDRSVWSSINEVMGIRYAVVMAVCEQDDEKDMGFTPEAISLPLEGLGYRVIQSVRILHLYAQGEAEKDGLAIDKARQAGAKLAETLRLKKEIEEKVKGAWFNQS